MSRLDRVEDWAERARNAEYDAGKLADLCHVSYSQLRRYFTSALHATPQSFLDEQRLLEAAHLLRVSSLSVKEIARDLHFADASELCHQFKRRFGVTPAEFGRKALVKRLLAAHRADKFRNDKKNQAVDRRR